MALVFILIVPAIYSIGIGIWVQEIEFQPNLNQNHNAFINNNVGTDIRVKLTKRGTLSEYLTFSDEYLDIPKGGRAYFTFNLKLPESIPPGKNRIDIGAEDITPVSGGGISAKTAVFMGFYVRAPYPGKYIEASFGPQNIEKDQTADFNVNVISRGNETINKIDGIIEIFDGDNKIDTVLLEPMRDVQPGASGTMGARWDSTGQPVGEYTARAYLNYDGEELRLPDATFKIGTLLVKITNYTKEFYKDEINRFDIEIESFWNIDVNDVYGEIEIDKQKIKTLRADLAPWSRMKITAYLDTTNLELGGHTANIRVYYADKVAEEVGKITILAKRERVVEMPSKMPSTTILLIVIISLLVIGNIILVFYYLKHGKTQKKKRK